MVGVFMHRLLYLAASLSIRTKLLVLIFIFLCVPFLISGILWYEKSTKSLENNATQYSQQLVNQISGHLDSYFSDLERSTFPLITHPHVQDYLQLDKEDRYGFISLNQKIKEELIPNFIFGRTDIYGFSIVSENGIIASYGDYIPDNILYNLLQEEQTEAAGKYTIQGIHYINDNPVLTVSRKFKDTLRYTVNGQIVINLKLNMITSIAEKTKLGDTGFIWIIGPNSEIIYHPEKEKWGQTVSPSYFIDIENNPSGSFVREEADGDKLIIYKKSSENDLILISEIPMKEVMSDMIDFRNLTIVGGSLLILFVLTVLMVYSYYLSKNLSNLQRLMKKAENGDLNVKAPEHRYDEIGGLNRSFNKMVTEIRRLIEVIHVSKLSEKEAQIKQREATMQALNSQINPHFLYNTLEVINSYAIMENVMPVSRMVTSLAKIFRYNMGNPKQIGKLQEEIDHIQTYFDIQKERYPYLHTEFDINSDDLEKVNSVRMILQPIIENAIVHGYEKHNMKPQYIGIIGKMEPQAYILQIVDRGGGMDAASKEKFNRYFTTTKSKQPNNEITFDNIGLWNVHYRLRLHFGEPYGIYIRKSNSSGTIIELILPYDNSN
jgi:two-component system sensor histidine kinase YesM